MPAVGESEGIEASRPLDLPDRVRRQRSGGRARPILPGPELRSRRCYTLGAEGHEVWITAVAPTSFTSRLALNEQTPQLELIEPLQDPARIETGWMSTAKAPTTSGSSSNRYRRQWPRRGGWV
jgi:hypothetical protein